MSPEGKFAIQLASVALVFTILMGALFIVYVKSSQGLISKNFNIFTKLSGGKFNSVGRAFSK